MCHFLKPLKCEKWQQKNRRQMGFSSVAAVSPPLLRSSLINIIKTTTIPKLNAVTHFLAEFLVSKSGTSPPLYNTKMNCPCQICKITSKEYNNLKGLRKNLYIPEKNGFSLSVCFFIGG